MHTNSPQHILISPDFKAHQSQLTGPSGPERSSSEVLQSVCQTCICELIILHSIWWVFLLLPHRLCSQTNISPVCMASVIISAQTRPKLPENALKRASLDVLLVPRNHNHSSVFGRQTAFSELTLLSVNNVVKNEAKHRLRVKRNWKHEELQISADLVVKAFWFYSELMW